MFYNKSDLMLQNTIVDKYSLFFTLNIILYYITLASILTNIYFICFSLLILIICIIITNKYYKMYMGKSKIKIKKHIFENVFSSTCVRCDKSYEIIMNKSLKCISNNESIIKNILK